MPLSDTGTYFLRVDGDNASSAQLYELQAEIINTAPSPFITAVSTRIIEESNSGANGFIDNGETILLGVTLQNNGNLAANNLIATLTGPSGMLASRQWTAKPHWHPQPAPSCNSSLRSIKNAERKVCSLSISVPTPITPLLWASPFL